jgi:hypothetical protein
VTRSFSQLVTNNPRWGLLLRGRHYHLSTRRSAEQYHWRIATQRRFNSHRQEYADNQNISFSLRLLAPPHASHTLYLHTQAQRILPLLFVQAHRETEAHFTATEMPSQHNLDNFFVRLSSQSVCIQSLHYSPIGTLERRKIERLRRLGASEVRRL